MDKKTKSLLERAVIVGERIAFVMEYANGLRGKEEFKKRDNEVKTPEEPRDLSL